MFTKIHIPSGRDIYFLQDTFITPLYQTSRLIYTSISSTSTIEVVKQRKKNKKEKKNQKKKNLSSIVKISKINMCTRGIMGTIRVSILRHRTNINDLNEKFNRVNRFEGED